MASAIAGPFLYTIIKYADHPIARKNRSVLSVLREKVLK